jgi:hypothetical protein
VPASPSYSSLNFYGYLQTELWNVASISAGNSASNTYGGILQFATNTTGGTHTTALTIDNQQRVGIGTTSPQSQLQVLDQIRVSNSAQSQGSIVLGDGGSTAFNVGIARWNINAGSFGAGGIGYFSQGTGNVGGHYFYTGDAVVGSQTARMVITPAGAVGIGTTAPGQLLEIHGASNPAALVKNTTSNVQAYFYASATAGIFGTPTSHPLAFHVENLEKARIDTSGRLLVGTSTSTSIATRESLLQLSSTELAPNPISVLNVRADQYGPSIALAKSRGGGSPAVQSNDTLGSIIFAGHDGPSWCPC